MPLSITELGAIWRWIHSPVKHLWWSFLRNCSQIKAITAKAKNKRSITNFAKSSIIGAWQGRTLRFRLLQKDCKFYFGHSYQLNPQIPTKYLFLHILVFTKKIAHLVSNKAKWQISKREFQENKASQIFRKTNISYTPWYVFFEWQKTWPVLQLNCLKYSIKCILQVKTDLCITINTLQYVFNACIQFVRTN